MYTDNHNHTKYYSPDSEMSLEELINSSKNLNIPRIAITEHYEIDYPHPDDPVQTFDIESYKKDFPIWRKLSEELNGPELLMGIEFGYQSHIAEEIDSVAASHPFDVVLLSNHVFQGSDVYFSKTCYDIPRIERHKEYIGTMAEMAWKCNNYNIIAHYDYINRYTDDKESHVFYSDCKEEFDSMFEAIISKGKSLEINTRSILSQMNKKASHTMPDEEIIRRYIDMGGKMFSLGSDSHKPDTIGLLFKETSEYLKSLGVKELTYFVKGEPHFEKL